MSRLYRQLFRVVAIGQDEIAVFCPGWDSETLARLPHPRLPEWLREALAKAVAAGQTLRFFAKCDLGADLITVFQDSVQDFEPAPEPSPDDGLV